MTGLNTSVLFDAICSLVATALSETLFTNVPFVNVLNHTVKVTVSPTFIGEKRPAYSLSIDILGSFANMLFFLLISYLTISGVITAKLSSLVNTLKKRLSV